MPYNLLAGNLYLKKHSTEPFYILFKSVKKFYLYKNVINIL